MSGEIILWAVRQDIKNHTAKLVLQALGDAYDDRTGRCFPSHESICDFVRRSETQIKQAIRWLEEEGWIKREARFTSTGRQTSNGYEINFEKGESFEAMIERRRKIRGEKPGGGEKSGGGGNPPGVGAENRPVEEAENSPPRTESLLNNSAQARETDFQSDEVKGVDWENRLANYRKRGIWPPKWGPRMGQPGCLVPGHLANKWESTQGAAFKEAAAPRRKATGATHIAAAVPTWNRPGTSHD
jgi:hypothetical protein